MNLREMEFLNEIGEKPPECILNVPLEQHLPNLHDFSSVVLALTFDSGPSNNPTARSYVFYFFKREADSSRRPDDILTFKIKFDDPFNVHIIDKYLGGVAYGPENAPALAYRHLWRPGMMSQEGKEAFMKTFPEAKEKKSGCFIATAVYNSQFAYEVQVLNKFKDNYLSKNFIGRLSIKIYYKISRSIGEILKRNIILKRFIKMLVIDPIVKYVQRFLKN